MINTKLLKLCSKKDMAQNLTNVKRLKLCPMKDFMKYMVQKLTNVELLKVCWKKDMGLLRSTALCPQYASIQCSNVQMFKCFNVPMFKRKICGPLCSTALCPQNATIYGFTFRSRSLSYFKWTFVNVTFKSKNGQNVKVQDL